MVGGLLVMCQSTHPKHFFSHFLYHRCLAIVFRLKNVCKRQALKEDEHEYVNQRKTSDYINMHMHLTDSPVSNISVDNSQAYTPLTESKEDDDEYVIPLESSSQAYKRSEPSYLSTGTEAQIR